MHEIDLDTAVREIVGTTRRKQAQIDRGEGGRLPFFFIVGAGVSNPPIPLAGGIEKLCREEIQRLGGPPPPGGASALDRYEASFKAAYPSAEDRQDFLHDLIDKKPISAANLRLAHLLGAGKLTNLVVTPNFDEMLSQALRLLGYHGVVVCDHPKTTQRIRLSRTSQTQIVHVHGTHWFYDCCNLRGEIEKRSEHDETDELSMLALVDKVLGDRSPLVVGYSGWEGDVIMTALKRRLRPETLPHNIYWFCYRREEADSLPSWLRDHPSVSLVLPPAPAPSDAKDRLQPFSASAESSGDQELSTRRFLSAARVFGALIPNLGLSEPPLPADPLAFFGGSLKANLALAAAEEGDIYLLREVLRRVERGVALEAETRTAAGGSLSLVNEAVRRLDWREAVAHAAAIDLAALTSQEQEELDAALAKVIKEVDDAQADLGLGACETRLRLALVASGTEQATLPWRERSARTLLRQGYFHFTKGYNEKAVSAFDELLHLFGDATEPALREPVAKALLNKGVVLGDTQDTAGEAAAYDEVLRRFGDATEPALREQVAMALFNKGVSLGSSQDDAGASAVYDEVLQRFGDATETALREQVAKALVNKGNALGRSQDKAGAIAAYDKVLQRFSEATEPALREPVARALVNKGVVLGDTQDNTGAVTTYDEVLQRFGDATEPALREQVARALFNKGVALGSSQDYAGAIAAYDEVLRRFGDATEPALREQVAKARYNLACALALTGRRDEALAELEGCFTRGEITRDLVRADIDWTALRDDPSFQRLVADDPENRGGSSS